MATSAAVSSSSTMVVIFLLWCCCYRRKRKVAGGDQADCKRRLDVNSNESSCQLKHEAGCSLAGGAKPSRMWHQKCWSGGHSEQPVTQHSRWVAGRYYGVRSVL